MLQPIWQVVKPAVTAAKGDVEHSLKWNPDPALAPILPSLVDADEHRHGASGEAKEALALLLEAPKQKLFLPN